LTELTHEKSKPIISPNLALEIPEKTLPKNNDWVNFLYKLINNTSE
jgi:hypothetical protein